MTAKEKACLFANTTYQYKSTKQKNYKLYNCDTGLVDKVFNEGHGSIQLYRFHNGRNNKVVANIAMESPKDRQHLLQLFPNAKIIEFFLGYPDYYNKSLPKFESRSKIKK